MNKWLKILLVAASAAMLVGVLLAAGLLVNNNWPSAPPADTELAGALEKTIQWLDAHADEVLQVNNPILWYRVKTVAALTGDPRLSSLFARYESRYLGFQMDGSAANRRLWQPLFSPGTRSRIPYGEISSQVLYVQHWVYAMHCDAELAKEPVIRAQNEAGFCGRFYLLAPTCTSHQLSGMLFLKNNQCGDQAQVAATIAELQQHLVNLLRFDPRLVDIYVQRALKLVESGAPQLLGDRWLRRILDAQQADGGWTNFEPVLPVGGGRYLGFGHADSRTGNPRGNSPLPGISVGVPHSTFHATTQGLMLLALLQRQSSAG